LFHEFATMCSSEVPSAEETAIRLLDCALSNVPFASLKAEGENADGENADGENADGENAEGLNAEGENAEGENAEGENAEGENADGENADGENAEGLNADGLNSALSCSRSEVVLRLSKACPMSLKSARS
jgi:hypothetical protein